ncbi:FAD-dependent oxidoreductase [Paraburkholderia sp. BR14374]|uniref:FAD-dependent oxidoreductase n=1 Tax=Paraburkholderia sp. BR14374 TaxID=3237007 RepID=UPI0034CD6857
MSLPSGSSNVKCLGGGATGVELAAELRRVERTLKQYRLLSESSAAMRVTLLERGDRVLPALPEKVSTATCCLLEKTDISVRVSTAVTKVLLSGVDGSLVSLASPTAVGSLAAISSTGKFFVDGFVAKLMYAALYRKHLMAVPGLR